MPFTGFGMTHKLINATKITPRNADNGRSEAPMFFSTLVGLSI